jgi:hypothetical protein
MLNNLSENFNSPTGKFPNYHFADSSVESSISGLSHINVRSFAFAPYDTWNAPIVSSTNNFKVLQQSISSGATVSIVNTPASSLGYSNLSSLIDISGANLSITLPGFVSTSVDLTLSYFYIKDAAGRQRAWKFVDAASVASGTLTYPFVRATDDLLDYTSISEVGFVVVSTAAITFTCSSIRVLGPNWTFVSQDIDTRGKRLKRTVPPSSNLNLAPTLVQPIMWRDDGSGGPKPIDSEYSVSFNTGSASSVNKITLAFREFLLHQRTQGELDMVTTGSLEGGQQPEYSGDPATMRIEFILTWGGGPSSITMRLFDGTTNPGTTVSLTSNLSANTNYIWFVRLEDGVRQASIYSVDSSGKTGSLLFDTGAFDDGNARRRKGRMGWQSAIVDGDASIESVRERKMNYAEYVSLPLESITPVDGAQLFAQNSPDIQMFDFFAPGQSDPTKEPLRQVDLDKLTNTNLDGNPQPEYGPFVSNTNSLGIIGLSRDSVRSTTGLSWKVVNPGITTYLGVDSNVFDISDFGNSEVKFDLFYTDDPAVNSLRVSLTDESRSYSYQFVLPKITPNKWQRVHLLMPFEQYALTGRYRLSFAQANAVRSTYWIDNISVFSRTINWETRAVREDPLHVTPAPWVSFKDLVNTGDGVLVAKRGTSLQVRGRALRPSSTISNVQIVPKYSELGNINQYPSLKNDMHVRQGDLDGHTQQELDTYTQASLQTLRVENYSFTTTNISTGKYRFVDTSTLRGIIANSEWNFGDGTSGIGEVVTHTFPTNSNYTVTLTTTLDNGKKTKTSHSISFIFGSEVVSVNSAAAKGTAIRFAGDTVTRTDYA